jgi:hypothetical protein
MGFWDWGQHITGRQVIYVGRALVIYQAFVCESFWYICMLKYRLRADKSETTTIGFELSNIMLQAC